MDLGGWLVLLASWLALATWGTEGAVMVLAAGPVVLLLGLRAAMPRTGPRPPPVGPISVDVEARRIREFAESLNSTPSEEGQQRDIEP